MKDMARWWIAEARRCEARGYHIMAANCRHIAEEILNG